jgi:hypothetical protein
MDVAGSLPVCRPPLRALPPRRLCQPRQARDTQRQRHTETHGGRDRQRQTETETHIDRQRQRHAETHRERRRVNVNGRERGQIQAIIASMDDPSCNLSAIKTLKFNRLFRMVRPSSPTRNTHARFLSATEVLRCVDPPPPRARAAARLRRPAARAGAPHQAAAAGALRPLPVPLPRPALCHSGHRGTRPPDDFRLKRPLSRYRYLFRRARIPPGGLHHLLPGGSPMLHPLPYRPYRILHITS